MEVVSTSNLVSSEAEKIVTACNFQTMPINSFLQICKYKAIRSLMMAELWKSTLRDTYTQNSKIKTDQQYKLNQEICFTLKMHYSLQ